MVKCLICYDKSDYVLSLLYCAGEASVMKNTVINTSKEMTAYSDFPPPKDFPNYMHNGKVIEYLQMYVAHFNLRRYIRFETAVKTIRKADDYDRSGKWLVDYRT